MLSSSMIADDIRDWFVGRCFPFSYILQAGLKKTLSLYCQYYCTSQFNRLHIIIESSSYDIELSPIDVAPDDLIPLLESFDLTKADDLILRPILLVGRFDSIHVTDVSTRTIWIPRHKFVSILLDIGSMMKAQVMPRCARG
jgi:hypothetical protein